MDSKRLPYRFAELRKAFGSLEAESITGDVIRLYVRKRQADGRANGTIKRDLNILRRAFNLAREGDKINTVPRFLHLPDGAPRKGFFTAEEVERLCQTLPAYLQDFTRFAFITGWRKSEIASLTWADVEGNEIRLRKSKNGEGRVITLNNALRDILAHQAKNPSIYLFSYRGRKVGDFKKAWRTATIRAGLGGRTFHDLRRSAVRNLITAGVTRQVAKRITGHKTDSVFNRYHIVTDDDVAEAMRRLDG